MITRYVEELEKRGIKNLDNITDDGWFTKVLINDKENYESGYVGVIQINKEGKVELIFVRHDLNERRLVCDNFRGTYIQSDLALNENRDPVTLFEDYAKDANKFIKIQSLKSSKYFCINRSAGITQERRNQVAARLDQEIEQLQSELEAGIKMY